MTDRLRFLGALELPVGRERLIANAQQLLAVLPGGDVALGLGHTQVDLHHFAARTAQQRLPDGQRGDARGLGVAAIGRRRRDDVAALLSHPHAQRQLGTGGGSHACAGLTGAAKLIGRRDTAEHGCELLFNAALDLTTVALEVGEQCRLVDLSFGEIAFGRDARLHPAEGQIGVLQYRELQQAAGVQLGT